ncbi:MAG: Peptidase M23 [Candidatus Uhrbacteria bacterium GW2011_GWE2_45_35]|uniref:Peptidase M23 n=2 Tax=Candidatus Uhriibacteriota TaxID=1752732 RepID=A0A0G1JKE4_9BACT|nr:MAG: Peptidase M23 [Candidatus Uhrbacteria bacterium GW2011_GWF2_44_350]KKU09099.1 MAG: Peptidase M23 [Candidatus Uhrbacteria bacterium GW2011_GWE2_45_35]HBR80351.1 hypothetical protein [Candidatus Uhrbacteria bacterium]HCU31282.1 hypothetical protein [Candidatus Uhrbacteria bacterium]
MDFWRKLIFVSIISSLFFQSGSILVLAETGEDIQQINDEIAARKVKIDQINSKINDYQAKIKQAESQQISLSNEIEILDNHEAQTELEIQLTNEEISTTDSEIKLTENSIAESQETLDRQAEIMASILREIRVADRVSVVEWFFGTESFSDLFGRIEDLETINSDLSNSLEQTKETKISLQTHKQEQENHLLTLESLQKDLADKIELLGNQKEAKTVLIAETAQSEANFQSLLNELLAEEQYVNRQIANLQYGIEQKLKDGDSAGDSSALSWPVYPERGLSATFHDPTYPFRYLFEHPGIDIPVSVGTPIKSVAPGYVAWVKEGTQYGYYVLVIHANGIATLYAHLSKILVEPDQFMARGEAVGLSGGRPGMPGAGLSTGPHLHFEVRKDGIPTNPMNYLVAY